MSRYTHNPDPQWTEAQAIAEKLRPPECLRRSRDPFVLHRDAAGDQSTEFSFGPGPVAPHLNGKPPSEGGAFRGRAPRVDPPPSGIGTPRPHRRPRGEARGCPGEQIAR